MTRPPYASRPEASTGWAGTVVFEGTSEALRNDRGVMATYLGVGG